MRNLLIISLLCFASASCKKGEEATPATPAPAPVATTPATPPVTSPADAGTLTWQGTFVNNSENVSGLAKIYTKDGKRTLYFENFVSSSGPDLRVYLSKDRQAGDFYELGKLQATNGTYSYVLAANTNPDDYKYVLIWCKQFFVLFGNAELKKP